MKILVIHPKDSSTEFLCEIYKDKPDWTIMTNFPNKAAIITAIESHDCILMMGHGSPSGLFNIGPSGNVSGYLIDNSMSVYLKNKQCAFIWCNADQYVKNNGLGGFYTGMFISEVPEANYCNIKATQQEITLSNYGFSRVVSKWLFNDDPVDSLKESYSFDSDVCRYNSARLYKVSAETNQAIRSSAFEGRKKMVDLIANEVGKKQGFVADYQDTWGLIMNAYQVALMNKVTGEVSQYIHLFGEAILSGNIEIVLIDGGKMCGLILEELQAAAAELDTLKNVE